MRIRLDPARCVGHGRCYDLAPELFGEDDEGHCALRQPVVPAGLEAKAQLGVDNCPEGALELDEA